MVSNTIIQQSKTAAFRYPVTPEKWLKAFRLCVFFGAHIPLALSMASVNSVATAHALATVIVGFWWGYKRRMDRVALVGAYIIGAEVLWRMMQAQVYWEFGKYATSAIFIFAMIRSRLFKAPALPVSYFLLLVPSIILTNLNLSSSARVRDLISFNLSGPFALAVGAWFFSHLKLSAAQVKEIFITMIAPIVGVGAVTYFSIAGSSIKFTNNSNLAASGGFGPNQVSAALGIGAVLSLFALVAWKAKWSQKLLMGGLFIFLAVQSALTFSRGGLYNAAGAIVLSAYFLMKSSQSRMRLIIASAIIIIAAQAVLLPQLDALTGGGLSARFRNAETTGRDVIALTELEIWMENPVLGIGPGMASFSYSNSAHTEFTRLLAEHGFFGFGALILLLVMSAQSIKRAQGAINKATAALLIAWSFLYMLNAAMRLAAPSFMLGMAFGSLLVEEASPLARGSARDLFTASSVRISQAGRHARASLSSRSYTEDALAKDDFKESKQS